MGNNKNNSKKNTAVSKRHQKARGLLLKSLHFTHCCPYSYLLLIVFSTSPPFFRWEPFPFSQVITFPTVRFPVTSEAHFLHRQLLCNPPNPLRANCAKSRHSRCRRYLSITLSPFCPSAKIKFAWPGTEQMLPLPWPLVALSQLRVSNTSRTLNLTLMV